MAAVVACDMMKVNSQNDRAQLDKAKELTYLRGFYEGVCTLVYVVQTTCDVSSFSFLGDDSW